MRKFESIQYLKRLGFPVAFCKEFTHDQLTAMLEFANYLRKHGHGCGLRTDYTYTKGTGCPFFMNVHNDMIEYLVEKYKDSLTYIISECIPPYFILAQGIVYLLPGNRMYVSENTTDKVSCREAIEKPSAPSYVVDFKMGWKTNSPILIYLRRFLINASRKDPEIIGKRIEWTLFERARRGMVFWQLSDDNVFMNATDYAKYY